MTLKQARRVADKLFRIAGVLFFLAGLIAAYRHRIPFAVVFLAIGGVYYAISGRHRSNGTT